MKAFGWIGLTLLAVAPAQGQEQRAMQEWPPELYTCVADGQILTFRTQFEPGRSEIRPAMQTELSAMAPPISAHKQSPEHCFLIFGAADTMRWRGQRTVWINDANDAVVSLARAEAIGNLLGRRFRVEPGRIQAAIVPGELPRNTAVALGRFFRRYAGAPPPTPELLRAQIGPELDSLKRSLGRLEESDRELRGRIDTLEEKDREQDSRLDDLDRRVSGSTRLGLALGGGYDLNRDYRMPQASASILLGTESRWAAEITAWYGRSLDESRRSFTYRGEDLTSDLYKWGYGGRIAAYLVATGAFAVGPAVEVYKYETLIKKLGEFSQSKRGISPGLVVRVSLKALDLIGSVGYSPRDEFKEAAGVGGLARSRSDLRASLGLQLSLTRLGR